MNIKKLTEELNKVADPRRSWGNKRHKLVDILVIGFSTIVCGGEDFTDMENLGIEKQEWLRTFLELPNGIQQFDFSLTNCQVHEHDIRTIVPCD